MMTVESMVAVPPRRSLRRVLSESRVTGPMVGVARDIYRRARTAYLRRRHPEGGFVRGNGVQVFVDFADPNYSWYDADAPNLAFDQALIRAVLPQVSGNVFLDVGAHFGFFAAFVAGMMRSGEAKVKLIAFEPDAHHFPYLERTMAPFRGPDITLLPFAVGDVDGPISLYESSDSACRHTYADETTKAVYTVESIRIDSVAERYLAPGDRIAFIKIDVDGAEPFVLAGARRVLATHRPVTFAEFAPKYLRRSNSDPREHFEELCARWHVYWIRYDNDSITKVGPAHYDAIEKSVGDGITDLLLAPIELNFPGLRAS